MHNQQLYTLFKNSRLAQVATPIKSETRSPRQFSPTHQVIYTPASSALRSNFGLKSPLPKQVGYSGIVLNNVDNKYKMPDVEKLSGYKFNRLRFQETELPLKKAYNKPNPLFAQTESQTEPFLRGNLPDTAVSKFNLGADALLKEVRALLRQNPQIRKQFRQWLLEKSPESVILRVPSQLDKLLIEFLLSADLVRKEFVMTDLIYNNTTKATVQGTAGFSYLQRGRLSNTPNGIRNGYVAPGRLVRDREAAIGGFVSGVNERTTLLQSNYIRNAPGKHSRQFVLPFKIVEAELSPQGSVRMYADGVKTGEWAHNNDVGHLTNYAPSNPNFSSVSERNQQDSNALEALLGLVSKPKR